MIPSAPNFTEANKGNTSKFAKNLFMPKNFPSVTSESEAKIKHLEPFTINSNDQNKHNETFLPEQQLATPGTPFPKYSRTYLPENKVTIVPTNEPINLFIDRRLKSAKLK